MSSVRRRAPSATRLGSNSNNATTKKKTLTKPSWDATNSDLGQFKPSQDELERRKQACQSKNVEVVKYEKQRQAMLKARKDQEKNNNSKAQLALLKEILYDDEQLKKLILKSDMTLKTVQDFFTDDDQQGLVGQLNENKKMAKINMTLAPNITDLNESNLPHNKSKPKNHQQRNVISSAKINNVNSFSDDEDTNSDNESEILNMKLKQAKQNEDFVRYRQLLELKQEMINRKLNSPSLVKIRDQQQQFNHDQENRTNPELNGLEECIKMLSMNKNQSVQGKAAEPPNDTEKINRLKDLIKTYASSMNLEQTEDQPKIQESITCDKKSILTNFNDELKRALSDLENKMYEFEKEIGQKKASECSIFKSLVECSSSGSSSYTMSLVKTVSSVLDYLRDTVKELNHEKLKNQETSKQLDIHRKLIDGLTNEILCVKEQNEKIGTVYINQANHQAKIEAELDQIKIMFRSSGLFGNQAQQNCYSKPPIIDSQPKTSSAFYPAQPTDLNNIIKPVAQASFNESQRQQDQPQLRPMSCINSINEYNRQNNVRYPLDDALNEVKSDRFIERLNAMLHQNNMSQTHEGQFSSASCNNLTGNRNTNGSLNQNGPHSEAMVRSSSAFGLTNQFREFNNSSDTFNTDGIHNSRSNDFNSQIQELCAKNAKAQQKFKQLQSEQMNTFGSNSSNLSQSCRSDEITPVSTNPCQKPPRAQENLHKLKSEQQLLKDQINMLNKQRESAQMELENLTNTTNVSVTSQKQGKKNSFMQNLQSIEFNRIEINQDISPNMSPIPNENMFHEGIETKSSTHRFAQNSDVINKNRD